MDLERLRAFVLAVRLGSVSAAAAALHRSQPAVTAKLQALEREVGEPLLVRGPRGVRASRTGERLYGRAQELLRAADELSADLAGEGAAGRGGLHIGATDVMAVYFLPRILQRLRRRQGALQLEVCVEGSRPLCERVVRGDLDLAFVTLPVEHAELAAEEVWRDPLMIVAAPEHRWTRRRVTLAQLAGEPMIMHRRESITRELVAAAFRVAGLEPRVAMEVSSPAAMKQLVALGLGIAPLSRALVAEEIRQARLTRLHTPEFRCFRCSGIVRRRDVSPRPAVSRLLELLPRTARRPAARGR